MNNSLDNISISFIYTLFDNICQEPDAKKICPAYFRYFLSTFFNIRRVHFSYACDYICFSTPASFLK